MESFDAAAGRQHLRLATLVHRAKSASPPALAIAHPCNAHALQAAETVLRTEIARPLLVGARDRILRAAEAAGVDPSQFEIVPVQASASGDTTADARAAARRAVQLAREESVAIVMKGSLHTDELMSAVVDGATGLRTERRISHAFVVDAPGYPSLLTLADCVVNIAPDLRIKRNILANALELVRDALGVGVPRVGIVTAIESVNPQIQATVDAAALVEDARGGRFGAVILEGPVGFDNAVCAKAAHIKGIDSQIAGRADLLIVPDLNSGNLLYKSLTYFGSAECAGVILGARVPVVMVSRADSLLARVCSVALATLAVQAHR